MNMQVVSAPAAVSPVPAPVQLHATDEPIVALIEAYRAGIAAYNASDDESDEFAQATYGPPLHELMHNTPPIRTIQGAITAMRFTKEEAENFNQTDEILGLIRRVLEFLESAAGADLLHLDAELLALGAQLRPLERENDELDEKFAETFAEAERLLNDRTGLEFTRQDAFLFGLGIREEGCSTIAPWRIKQLRPFDLDNVDPMCKQHALQFNRRLAELTAARDAYRNAIDEFEELSGRKAIAGRMDDLYELRAPLMERILAIPARTIAGLTVKANLAKRQNPAWWREPRERQEFDAKCAIAVIDDVLALQGVTQ